MTTKLEQAFKEGWLVAANWAGRDDLVYDIDSSAYYRDMRAALAGAHLTQPAQSMNVAKIPDAKPLPDLMMASYHEAIGWNAYREAMLTAALQEKGNG